MTPPLSPILSLEFAQGANGVYVCKACDIVCDRRGNFIKHIFTSKHERNVSGLHARVDTPEMEEYVRAMVAIRHAMTCTVCNFKANTESDWQQHLSCITHIQAIVNSTPQPQIQPQTQTNNTCNQVVIANDNSIIADNNNANGNFGRTFQCMTCNRQYKHQSSLSHHKRICKPTAAISSSSSTIIDVGSSTDATITTSTAITPQVILDLVSRNQELQTMLIAQSNEMQRIMNAAAGSVVVASSTTPNISTANQIIMNNNTTVHGNLNRFNMNIFLNEQCKNAINLSEFVESIRVQLSDLLTTADHGYVEGITSIFMKHLHQLEVHERPIHCTDLKREVMYVKECNMWEREENDKPRLKHAIGQISMKNIQQIAEWKKDHPDYRDLNTQDGQAHLNLMVQTLGGNSVEHDKHAEKIIRNLAKEVVVDKDKGTPSSHESATPVCSNNTHYYV